MTLSQRIERIKQQLEATKPRSQRRTELQAQLRELRTKQIRNENIIDEIAA